MTDIACCEIGSKPARCVDTAMPLTVCVWSTQRASWRAAWMALWMTKPGLVDRERRVADLLALQVDLHQARGRDLVEEEPVRVDQELIFGARHPHGDVREGQILPAVPHQQP
jgi:hypothetical protein